MKNISSWVNSPGFWPSQSRSSAAQARSVSSPAKSHPSSPYSRLAPRAKLCVVCNQRQTLFDPRTKTRTPYCSNTCALRDTKPEPKRPSISPPAVARHASNQAQAIDNLCETCRRRPKYIDAKGVQSPYCSKTCGRNAIWGSSSLPHTGGQASQSMTNLAISRNDLCEQCHQRPKHVEPNGRVHPFCGITCAMNSRNNSQVNLSSQSQTPTPSSARPPAPISRPPSRNQPQPISRPPSRNQPQPISRPPSRNQPYTNSQHHPAPDTEHQPTPTTPAPPTHAPQAQSNAGPPGLPPHVPPVADISSQEKRPSPIFFYHRHDPHYGFTNFSDHPVQYRRRIYPTSEHLFQALKFYRDNREIAEWIRKCRTSREAFDMAHLYKDFVRSDWFHVNIEKMERVIRLKFDQHPSLKEELLATGDAPLVEASHLDNFWGFGPDEKGRNELGKALVRLRESFRRETDRLRGRL